MVPGSPPPTPPKTCILWVDAASVSEQSEAGKSTGKTAVILF